MPDKKLGLPIASFDILRDIIKEYARKPVPRTPNEVVSDSGISLRNVTKSNTFLTDIGLLTAGKQKSPTDTCKELARLIQIELIEDEKSLWRKIIQDNEFLSELLSMIQTHSPIDKTELIKRTIHKSGRGSSHDNITGVNNIFYIFEYAEFIKIHEGNVHFSSANLEIKNSKKPNKIINEKSEINESEDEEKSTTQLDKLVSYDKRPSVVINLQLEIPIFENTKDYDAFFASLRKNLIDD